MQNWTGVIKAVNEFGKADVNGVVWKFTKNKVITTHHESLKFTNGRFSLK
jgi:hypothetical protein